MELTYENVQAMIQQAVKEIVSALSETTKQTKSKPEQKTAYAKTEALLYNYRGFQRIVRERMAEIEEIKKYGVPKKGGAVVEYGSGGSVQRGLVLPEESVESAVCRIKASVQDTVQAIALIDKCMSQIASDPYYKILEMRYFEGRTQDDIALEFNCSQVTISKNKSRLVRELSMRLFPNQAVEEFMN